MGSFGDDVYDAVGATTEGVCGFRLGPQGDSYFAYFERSAAASAAFRTLTGVQPPGAGEFVPVLSSAGDAGVARAHASRGSAWATDANHSRPTAPSLAVALEQTLTVRMAATPPTAASVEAVAK